MPAVPAALQQAFAFVHALAVVHTEDGAGYTDRSGRLAVEGPFAAASPSAPRRTGSPWCGRSTAGSARSLHRPRGDRGASRSARGRRASTKAEPPSPTTSNPRGTTRTSPPTQAGPPYAPGGLVRADGRFLPVHHMEPVADNEGRILGSSGGTPPFVTSGGGVAHVDGDGRDVCRVEPSADRKTVRTRTPRAPRCGSAPRPSGPSPRRADTLRGRAGLRRRHRAANSGSPPSGGARRQRLRARTARGALRRRPPATPPAAPHSDSAPPGPGRRTARAAMSSSRRPRL